jgi:hypothetical protein
VGSAGKGRTGTVASAQSESNEEQQQRAHHDEGRPDLEQRVHDELLFVVAIYLLEQTDKDYARTVGPELLSWILCDP